ncbi:unnamed protein product [Amoebophrya sp. A25]|nr:unnamed protein product [Amoebophrya sp. A25]|eukprot:GSA25T00013344001.1
MDMEMRQLPGATKANSASQVQEADMSSCSETTSATSHRIRLDAELDKIATMDKLYAEIAKNSFNTSGKFPGSCGLSAVMIAYAGYPQPSPTEKLPQKPEKRSAVYKTLVVVQRAALHRGDSDSTGSIALSWYGGLFSFQGVPSAHCTGIEYAGRCRNVTLRLSKILERLEKNTN